jgi:flagellar basal body-associated protein FliL
MSENTENTEQAQGEAKSGGTTFIIIGAVVVLIIIAVIGAIIVKKKMADKSELDSQRELIKVNWKSK